MTIRPAVILDFKAGKVYQVGDSGYSEKARELEALRANCTMCATQIIPPTDWRAR